MSLSFYLVAWVNEAKSPTQTEEPKMILSITHESARKLAIEDAHRAMKAAEYDGVGFDRGEAYDDFRFRGLGDVLILNPGTKLQDGVVETYEQTYRDTWHLA